MTDAKLVTRAEVEKQLQGISDRVVPVGDLDLVTIWARDQKSIIDTLLRAVELLKAEHEANVWSPLWSPDHAIRVENGTYECDECSFLAAFEAKKP